MIVPLLLAALVATAPTQCPLPHETHLIVTQLFFGRDVAGRGPVSDAEWSDFAANTIATNFPDGFTVSDGEGQWFDPKAHAVEHERSKIVIVAARPTHDLPRRIEAVMDAYRARFHQESVGVLNTTECGSF